MPTSCALIFGKENALLRSPKFLLPADRLPNRARDGVLLRECVHSRRRQGFMAKMRLDVRQWDTSVDQVGRDCVLEAMRVTLSPYEASLRRTAPIDPEELAP